MDPGKTDRGAPSITFDFTTRVTVDGRTAILLHLFRGGAPALTRTIVTVEHGDAVRVLLKCRQHLERRGIPQLEDDAALSLPVIRRIALLA